MLTSLLLRQVNIGYVAIGVIIFLLIIATLYMRGNNIELRGQLTASQLEVTQTKHNLNLVRQQKLLNDTVIVRLRAEVDQYSKDMQEYTDAMQTLLTSDDTPTNDYLSTSVPSNVRRLFGQQ